MCLCLALSLLGAGQWCSGGGVLFLIGCVISPSCSNALLTAHCLAQLRVAFVIIIKNTHALTAAAVVDDDDVVF